ncbi:EamA family transporter [Clostridium cuniculi]|uniref:EamA family transporter n=1 Tax=Clostridium TaxID=1485 RepID=UPI001056D3BB|nr:EamA family transporter [Clostridium cuniculi]
MEKLLESLRKNKIGIIMIITSAVITAFGQYFWKISEGSKIIELLIGFSLYGIGAILMIIAFKFGSLSVLHPMMSIGYVVALFIGYFLLGENITIFKVIAIIFILIGVILMGVGDE